MQAFKDGSSGGSGVDSGGTFVLLCSPLKLFTEGEEKDGSFAKKAVIEMTGGKYVLTEASAKALKSKVHFL